MPTNREPARPRRNALQDSWIDWLSRGCFLSVKHVCLVLDLDPSTVHAFMTRPVHGRPRALPTGPPRWRTVDRARIAAQTSVKARRLAELGYSIARSAIILDVEAQALRSFLTRCRPVRRASISRPRDHTEQRRLEANRRRRRRRRKAAAVNARPPTSWRSTWDRRRRPADPETVVLPAIATELDQDTGVLPAIAAAPVELGADQARAAKAPPARNPWVGPTTMKATGADNGSAKLSEADAREVLRLHAEGMSIYALARKYTVNDGTIRAIVRGVTWKHLRAVPSPLPG